jgi:hypothetical protein
MAALRRPYLIGLIGLTGLTMNGARVGSYYISDYMKVI